jgi:glycosyltransferase involved in cell wall biosynthesis
MMRLAIDARKYRDFGIGTYIKELAHALDQESDISAQYLAAPGDVEAIRRTHRGEVFPEPSGKYSLRELLTIGRVVNRMCVEIFHEPHYTLPYFLKPPTVVTIHDLIHIKCPEYFSPLQRLYAARMIHHAAEAATAVIVDSDHTKRDLAQFHPRAAEKITVIPLGVAERFTSGGEGLGEGMDVGVPGDAPFVLYVGSLRPHKNVPTLLQAIALLKRRDVRLVLVGEPLGNRPALNALAHQLKVAGRVLSLGWISDENLAHVYRRAAVVVVPSRYEGFGFPVLEAMAAGTPVISSCATSLPEVVGDAGILFDPESPDELQDAIERVLGSDTLRASLRERGRQRVKEFTWRRCAERTLGVYRSLIR